MSGGAYPKSYGSWSGNPQGQAPNYLLCCAEILDRTTGWARARQCGKPKGHGPDGAYCALHDPAHALAQKQIKAKNERYRIHGREFYEALVKIAEGRTPPSMTARDFAASVVERFNRASTAAGLG